MRAERQSKELKLYLLQNIGNAAPIHEGNRIKLLLRTLFWLGDICAGTDTHSLSAPKTGRRQARIGIGCSEALGA